eukprot:5942312-Alexandrium_andersonii.AAC.1
MVPNTALGALTAAREAAAGVGPAQGGPPLVLLVLAGAAALPAHPPSGGIQEAPPTSAGLVLDVTWRAS